MRDDQFISFNNFQPDKSQSSTLCRFWKSGFCRDGESCAFRHGFLHDADATSRRVVPIEGLGTTPSGKIKLKWDESAAPEGDREVVHWPLPYAQTCFHIVKLPNYASRRILMEKLFTALEHRNDGFAEQED